MNTALVCFKGPIMTQLTETAPNSVMPIPIDRMDFKNIVYGLKKSLNYENLIFVMGDLKRIMSIFKIIPPTYFKEFKHVTMIFSDGVKPQWAKPMRQLSFLADKVILMDQYTDKRVDKIIPGIYLPIHKKHWYNGQEKDIGLSFYGSTSIYPERRETLAFLENAGIKIVTGGGEENQYPLNMMNELRRSKITLNFGNCLTGSQHNMRKFQIKGRIWEAAMAKCVVIEPRNPETVKIFTDKEIVWYDDMEELPELIGGLLMNSVRRKEIAEKAFDKAKQYADPDIYWRKLL